MDIRLKQRLVGAVVLVALAVIFVPMILQTPEQIRAPDTAIPTPPNTSFPDRLATPVPEPPAAANEPGRQVVATPTAVPPEAKPQAAPAAAPALAVPSTAELSNAEDVTAVKPTTTTSVPTAWVVQVGVFDREQNAQILAKTLRDKGYTTFVERFAGKAGPSFRVRIGPFKDQARAIALQDRLKRENNLPGMVKSYP